MRSWNLFMYLVGIGREGEQEQEVQCYPCYNLHTFKRLSVLPYAGFFSLEKTYIYTCETSLFWHKCPQGVLYYCLGVIRHTKCCEPREMGSCKILTYFLSIISVL